MLFINVETKEYPISENELRQRFLNMSLPRFIKREDVLNLGYDVVVETAPYPNNDEFNSYEQRFVELENGWKVTYRKKEYDGTLENLKQKLKISCTKERKAQQKKYVTIDDVNHKMDEKTIQSLSTLIDCFNEFEQNIITFKAHDSKNEILWMDYTLDELKTIRKIIVKHIQMLFDNERNKHIMIDQYQDTQTLLMKKNIIHQDWPNSVYTIE